MTVRIPRRLYVALPWICILIATLGLYIDPGFVKFLCILSLYVYAGVILFVRLMHKGFKEQGHF